MKHKKTEPAEKLLTLTPDYQATLRTEGFIGALYRPKTDLYQGKVLVMVGGTDGSFALTKLIAEQFVQRGLSVLALAYWNMEGLPKAVCRIPLEYGETAALWLKKQGFEKVGIWGISQGAVFAMLCASYFPDLYRCAIGVSPMCVCGQGWQKKNEWVSETKLCEGSTFQLHGVDLPYFPLKFSKRKIITDSLKRMELCELSMYDGAVAHAPEDTRIPVERMQGALLLLAAEHDALWEAHEASQSIVSRLKAKNFPYPVVYAHYPIASHYLLPYPMLSRKIFRLERKYPDACAESNRDSFEKTLEFLRTQW